MANTKRKNRFGSGNGGDISAAIRQNTEAQSRAALQNGTLPVWKGPSPSKSGTGATAGNAASLPGSDAFQPKEKTTLGDVLSNPMYYAEKVVSAPLDALQSGLKDMFSGTKKQEARLNTNQQMQEAATPSKAKLAEGTIVKGADQAVSGITATLDWLIGNPLKSLGWESNPISEWNKYVQTNKEANEVYYAKNLANGSKAQKIVDEYGSATVAAIPQAIVAMMTAGSSLGAQGAGALTAGGTQLAGAEATAAASAAMNASKVASAANTIRNVTTTMAKDKNFWASFAQVAGQGYQDAKADGASEWEANMFALTNGLCNAAIEVGGGIQTLPVELQAGKKGLRAWITSAAEEGQEEVVQGVLERALQNLVYDRGNPIASVSDENAVLNPVTSAKEFAGGFVVGGVLGGGQTLASKALTPSAGRGKTAGVRGAVAGQSAIDRQINYSLVELGLNYAEGSKSRAIAEDMAAKLDAAEDMTKSGVTAKDYGRLLRTMQSEQSARPDLSHNTTARVVNEDGKVVTQMSSVAEAFRTQGDTAPVAVEKAQILERMMSGEQVSNKQLEQLGLRDKNTQAVLTQLTGVEVPQNATNSQLRQVFRAAAETAVEAKKAEQALGRSVAQAQVAVEKAQAENAARADEAAASLMSDAQERVAKESTAGTNTAATAEAAAEADRGIMVRDGQYISREDFLEYAENYLKERGLPATPEQVEALYERMKQYNTDNGPLVASEEAKAENAFSVDDTADATPVREPGSATKEQQWTARLVADSLQHLGVKAVVFDGAKLGSANAMIADGTIYLNEHKLGSQRMITWAIGHELVHPGANSDANLVSTIIGAFDKLSMSGALTETMQSQVDNLDAIIAEKTDVYKRYLVQERGMSPQQADKIVTEDYVREEIAADWMGEVFASQNTLERLAGIEPGLVTKALRALANIRAHGETALLKGGKDNSTATRRLDGLEQRLKSALERAEMTSRAPARPEAESIDTAGKTAYNETVEGESQTAEKTQSTTTEKPKASPELQDVMDRLAKGEDVSLDEINRTPEVDEVRKLPTVNTADIHTPEREHLRTEVLEKLYKRGSYSSETHDYTGEIAHDRRIDIVVGAPGAGKSSVLVNPLSEQHKSRVIDSDDAKAELPEYNKGKGADSVHREGSGIRNRLLDRAIDNGENIVWPTVGDKLNKLLTDIQNFKNVGYSVYLHLNELSAGKATGRALGRYLSEGRFIDPEVVLNVGNKPTQNYEYIRQQEGLIDGYSHYSNDVPRGEKPILIERSAETRGDVGGILRETDTGGAERLVRRQSGRTLENASGETAEAEAEAAADADAKKHQKEQIEMRKTAQASEDAGAVSVSGDLRYSVGDFSEQVDKALNGEWDRYNALYVGETSPLMEELGLKQLPVLMTSKHLNDIVAEKSSSDRRKHGLTPDQVKSLGGILSDPAMVLDSAQRNDAIVFVSDQTDADGLPIVAAIRPNGSGVYEMTSQPTNFLLSMYGRENFDKFIESAAREGRILYVNKIKSQSLRGDAGVQFATGLSSADSDGIVHQSRNVVNTEAKEAPAKNPDERFSVDSDTQADLDRVFDSDDFRAFLSDFYSGYGSAETGTTTDTTQQVSRVRSNTLEQSRRESAARMLGEERGKAIDRILTMDEKHLDEMSPEKYTYDVETEKQSMSRAKERLAQDYDGTKAALENGVWRSGEDLDAAMGVLASELAEARRTGNYDEAVEWAHLIQEQGTGAGQFIHAFAKYTRSPEGVLVRAAEVLDKAGVDPVTRDDLLDRIADFTKTLGAIETGDKNSLIQLILDQAEQRNTKVSKRTLKNLGLMNFEYLYDAALNQMDQIAQDYLKPSIGKQISTFQTISHLLNLRTGNRNVGSNQVFDVVGTIRNDVALLPDAILGAISGRRVVGVQKSWGSKAKRSGALEGLHRSWIEASLDIAPDAANSRDKYGTSRRTWKMTGNRGARVMSTVEKAMGFELNVTDEFHKGSVTGETLESLARAVERGDITQAEAEAWAREEALYRSFQDDTFIGSMLGNIKNLFNTVGVGKSGKKMGNLDIKEFGLGDLVQKYTQVPGALITRAIEFSPTGYLKAIYNTAQFVKASKSEKVKAQAAETAAARAEANPDRARQVRQAFRAKTEAEQARVETNRLQRKAALAFGQATTGTGIIAAFAMLAAKGLLKRAGDEDDADAKALKASEGISGTQLNLSALGRWIEGESPDWKTGDDLVSVEFLEPLNALMTVGALVAKDNVDASFWEKVGNYGGDSMEALYQSILEIPTMQTIQTVQSTVQYHDEDGALPLWAEIPFEVARGSVTGFIPSPIRQAAQASDEVYRETYGDKNIWNQTKSSVQNSMPGARNQLDPKLDNFGQAKKLESTARNVLNAFVNPGSLRTYRQSTVSKELDRVYAATDDANIYPDRNAPYTTSYTQDGKKKDFKLTADERQAYQRSRGQTTYRLMQDVMNDPVYKHLSAEDRGEVLTQVKGYSNYVAKKEFLSAHGESYSDDKYEKYSAALQTGMTLSQYLTAKDAVDEAEGVIDPKTGKTKSGTKMADAIEIIDGFDLTPEQKDFMLRSKYPTTKKKVRWH